MQNNIIRVNYISANFDIHDLLWIMASGLAELGILRTIIEKVTNLKRISGDNSVTA